MKIISTLIAIYITLFILLSHSAILACRFKDKMKAIPETETMESKCPDFPDFFFSTSDLLIS